MVRVPLQRTCNMVSNVICAWFFVFAIVVVANGANDTKRDKRTVDLFLRGAADLFGYDVVRRISSPSLRQVAAPRPTLFPPPVAPQLPSGSYSRVILTLGQQQQQQQQQLQQQLAQALRIPPLAEQIPAAAPRQRTVQHETIINLPQSGSLRADAHSITFPNGGLLPIVQVPAPQIAQVAPVPVIQALAPLAVQPATPIQIAPFQQPFQAVPFQQQPVPVAPAAPPAPAQQQVAPAPPPPPAPQPAPAAPQQSAQQNQGPAPVQAQDQNNLHIPLQIVAIAPVTSLTQALQSQNTAQAAPQGQSAQLNAPAQQQQDAPQVVAPAGAAGMLNLLKFYGL